MSTSVRKAKQAKPAKQAQFRDNRQGEYLPTSIDAFSQLTVDAAMKVALTTAGVKLTIEIDAAGTRVFLADQRSNRIVGGSEDLAKLAGIRAFVNRERKETSGIEIARVIAEISYRANMALCSVDPGYHQKALETSYGASIRPLLTVLAKLAENQKKLAENSNELHERFFRPRYEEFFNRIRNVYFRHIVMLTAGESKKGQLAELLFEFGVPEYVHSKFTNQNFVLDRSQELARVLFPSDPSKGLALTFKEWRSAEFLEKIGFELLNASGVVKTLVNNDDFVRSITKIDSSIGLSDETNPIIAKMIKSRVLVIPPMNDSRYVTEPGGKVRSGWKFPSPSMDTPSGAIACLSISMMRIYSANLQSVDIVNDFYHHIAPGAISRAGLTPTNNFYVQWQAMDNPSEIWSRTLRGLGSGVERQNLWRWIRIEMRLSEKADTGKCLATSLKLEENGGLLDEEDHQVQVQIPDTANPGQTLVQTEVRKRYPRIPLPNLPAMVLIGPPTGPDNIQAPITAVEIPLVAQHQDRIFPKKIGKKTGGQKGTPLTSLTQEGKMLIGELRKVSTELATRMTNWLRSFSDERLQAAAAKLAIASFDELFLKNELEEDEESVEDPSENEE